MRAEITRGNATIDSGVIAPGGFELIIPLVADIGETRYADTHRSGKQGYLLASDDDIAGSNAAVSEAVDHSACFIDLLFGLH